MTTSRKPNVTFVVQRYGPDIVGGAEQLARAWAHLLADRASVTVATTAARDERTWRNEFPPGESMDGAVRVLRFPVNRERREYFHKLHSLLQGRAESWRYGGLAGLPERGGGQRVPAPPAPSGPEFTRALEMEWMRSQGPYAPELLRYLEGAGADRYVFFSYLYPTTVLGIERVPAHSFVVPTLHDELPAYFGSVRAAMARASGRLWISRGERDLGGRLWGLGDGPILSMPLSDSSPPASAAVTLASREKNPGRHMILYSGRIDVGKGVDELLAFYERFCTDSHLPVELVLIGRVSMQIPKTANVRVLGFVSEDEKRRLLGSASVFVMPSPRESLSIALLEALRDGTPVLVSGRSQVLRDHVTDSGAGAIYHDAASFSLELGRLLGDGELRAELGSRGALYARQLTDPDNVRRALCRALALD